MGFREQFVVKCRARPGIVRIEFVLVKSCEIILLNRRLILRGLSIDVNRDLIVFTIGAIDLLRN